MSFTGAQAEVPSVKKAIRLGVIPRPVVAKEQPQSEGSASASSPGAGAVSSKNSSPNNTPRRIFEREPSPREQRLLSQEEQQRRRAGSVEKEEQSEGEPHHRESITWGDLDDEGAEATADDQERGNLIEVSLVLPLRDPDDQQEPTSPNAGAAGHHHSSPPAVSPHGGSTTSARSHAGDATTPRAVSWDQIRAAMKSECPSRTPSARSSIANDDDVAAAGAGAGGGIPFMLDSDDEDDDTAGGAPLSGHRKSGTGERGDSVATSLFFDDGGVEERTLDEDTWLNPAGRAAFRVAESSSEEEEYEDEDEDDNDPNAVMAVFKPGKRQRINFLAGSSGTAPSAAANDVPVVETKVAVEKLQDPPTLEKDPSPKPSTVAEFRATLLQALYQTSAVSPVGDDGQQQGSMVSQVESTPVVVPRLMAPAQSPYAIDSGLFGVQGVSDDEPVVNMKEDTPAAQGEGGEGGARPIGSSGIIVHIQRQPAPVLTQEEAAAQGALSVVPSITTTEDAQVTNADPAEQKAAPDTAAPEKDALHFSEFERDCINDRASEWEQGLCGDRMGSQEVAHREARREAKEKRNSSEGGDTKEELRRAFGASVFTFQQPKHVSAAPAPSAVVASSSAGEPVAAQPSSGSELLQQVPSAGFLTSATIEATSVLSTQESAANLTKIKPARSGVEFGATAAPRPTLMAPSLDSGPLAPSRSGSRPVVHSQEGEEDPKALLEHFTHRLQETIHHQKQQQRQHNEVEEHEQQQQQQQASLHREEYLSTGGNEPAMTTAPATGASSSIWRDSGNGPAPYNPTSAHSQNHNKQGVGLGTGAAGGGGNNATITTATIPPTIYEDPMVLGYWSNEARRANRRVNMNASLAAGVLRAGAGRSGSGVPFGAAAASRENDPPVSSSSSSSVQSKLRRITPLLPPTRD